MISQIILFVVKIIDNVILTAKSITTYKNKVLITCILVWISQFLFCEVVKKIIADNSIFNSINVSNASAIGAFIAFKINNKYKKDEKWIYYLTCSDMDDLVEFCKYLVEHNIKYQCSYGCTRKWKDTMNITAFSKTKNESRLIEQYIKDTDSKYLKEIMK